jgi:hypothetical protein
VVRNGWSSGGHAWASGGEEPFAELQRGGNHRAGRGRFGRISVGGTEIFERGRGVDDQRCEEWEDAHRLGYVLNIRERQSVVLHHADCHALELMGELAFQQRMTSATKVCASL